MQRWLVHEWARKNLLYARLQLMTQQARASSLPEVLPAENPFAFPEWGRLRNNCKRRGCDGGRKASPILLHSHPIKSLSSHPAHSRWRCIFGARIPFPARGREPTAPDPRASVLALLALLVLARSCCRGLPPLPPNPRTPFLLIFSSFFLLLTHFSTHHDGTTSVALLRGGPGKRQYAPPGLHSQCRRRGG